MRIEESKCSVEESFIDFMVSKEKTGQGLVEKIIQKLQSEWWIKLSDACWQGYANEADMAGKYKGVQTRIIQQNMKARFVSFFMFVSCFISHS